MTESVNATNLSQRTADSLRHKICEEKTFGAGEKLPNEIILSEELGVSRATLREAIRILVSERILEVHRGRGTFVAAEFDRIQSGGLHLEGFEHMKVTLRDLYETRMIFEPAAAALACRRASDEEIEEILRLGEICQKQLKKGPSGKRRIQTELDFHNSIVKACHNDFISEFMPVLTETIEKTFDLDYNLDVLAEDAYKDHIVIMNFLKKRDAEAAKSAVTIHLHHAMINEQLDCGEMY